MEFARASVSHRVLEVACDENGALLTNSSIPDASDSASTYNVPAAITTSIFANASTARKGLIVENDSIYSLYLKFGATASPTSYTVKITPFGYYELPPPIYRGNIDGIWDGVDGSARVTDLS